MSTSSITIHTSFDGFTQHGSFTRHMWHRYKLWVIIRSILCLVAIIFGAYWLEPGGEANLIGGALVTVGSLGIMRPMIWQMWHERSLRKHPAYDTKVCYIFDQDGIEMSGLAGSVTVPWKAFYELYSTSKGLLIYQDKKRYIWISKASYTDEQLNQILSWSERSYKQQ